MDTNNWISLISAILIGGGTITLAIMTWKSIRQTRDIQQRERRERLLNEIIEWAISAREWDFTKEDRDHLEAASKPWNESHLIITSNGEIVMSILRVGHIMNRFALSLNRKSIDEKIKSLMTELLKTHKSLGMLRGQIIFSAAKTPLGFQKALEELGKQHNRMRQAAEDVVTEVGELIPNI